MELSRNNLTYSHVAVFHRIAVFFYRKGRKGFAEGAKASRPLQSPCALCGDKPQHDGKKSSYFVTIPKGALKNKGFMAFPHNSQ
jgi:hypothetical protein